MCHAERKLPAAFVYAGTDKNGALGSGTLPVATPEVTSKLEPLRSPVKIEVDTLGTM
jgi:hypothetical protein